MSIFQYIAIPTVMVFAIIALANLIRGYGKRRIAILWFFIWVTAGIAIYKPNSLTVIANTLGIERGADLVFYCAVIGSLLGFFVTYMRYRYLNRQLTQLVRQIAIDTAQQPTSNLTISDSTSKDAHIVQMEK